MPKPSNLRERPLKTQKSAKKEQWTCGCANADCKGTWTSETDELKCPFCGGEDVLCAKDDDDNGDNGDDGDNDDDKGG